MSVPGQNIPLYVGNESTLLALSHDSVGEWSWGAEPNLEDIPQSGEGAMQRALISNAVNLELGTQRYGPNSKGLEGLTDDVWAVWYHLTSSTFKRGWALKVKVAGKDGLDFQTFPGIIMQTAPLLQRSKPYTGALLSAFTLNASTTSVSLGSLVAGTDYIGLAIVTEKTGAGSMTLRFGTAAVSGNVDVGLYELATPTSGSVSIVGTRSGTVEVKGVALVLAHAESG